MTNHIDTPPAGAAQPRHTRAGARLSTTARLGTSALLAGAAPLTAAILAFTPWSPNVPVPAAASSARHSGAALNAEAQSRTTVVFSAIGGGKFPKEGGD
jgi:hypothetical protein